jgi:hypothetical protein
MIAYCIRPCWIFEMFSSIDGASSRTKARPSAASIIEYE